MVYNITEYWSCYLLSEWPSEARIEIWAKRGNFSRVIQRESVHVRKPNNEIKYILGHIITIRDSMERDKNTLDICNKYRVHKTTVLQ